MLVDVVRHSLITLLQSELDRDPTLCREVPGAAAILAELGERSGFTISLATGCWRGSAELKLQRAGLYREHIPLELLGGDKVHSSVKFVKGQAAPSPRELSQSSHASPVGRGWPKDG
jgi:hypothetical protein